MGKTYSLNSKALRELAKSIEQDIQPLLERQAKEYVEALLDAGIQVARVTSNSNGYGKMIGFTKEISVENGAIIGTMTMFNTAEIDSVWLIDNEGNTRSAIVSPILMAEFGAGAKAKNELNINGVGRGTFPTGTGKGNKNFWYYRLPGEQWVDEDGNVHPVWHISHGIKPTQPMLRAAEAMRNQANDIRKKVLGK